MNVYGKEVDYHPYQAACVDGLKAENAKLREEVGLLLRNQPITRADAREETRLKAERDAALLQNRLAEQLADHYTGTLWTEETRKAASEILMVLRGAQGEIRYNKAECYPLGQMKLGSTPVEKRKCEHKNIEAVGEGFRKCKDCGEMEPPYAR